MINTYQFVPKLSILFKVYSIIQQLLLWETSKIIRDHADKHIWFLDDGMEICPCVNTLVHAFIPSLCSACFSDYESLHLAYDF